MIKRLTYCICFTLSVCFGCNPFNGKQPELWFYTHSIEGEAVNDSLLTPASFLYLKKDGSYTRDFGVFEYGRWIKKEGNLLLTNTGNTTTTLSIKYEGSKELQLITGENIVSNFEVQPTDFTSKKQDPFSLTNNRWRIVAKQKENEQQIKKRLQNHCKFWEAYFTWALDNNLTTVDVRSTPTPIKIYGNGFGLKPFDELPAEWRSYFYDSSDCMKANNIVQDIFEHRNIAWAHTDSKYKMFISAFQQMQQHLR